MLAGALSVLLVMVVLLAIKKGLDGTSIGLGVIPFALMPIVFLNWNNLKEIKKELNSRKNVI
ncbi:redox-active disulfide protein 2 [Spirosoma telluris]|uniref:redox-active disulfide protein 2 n=1 Tax=Spirosoma telluris TaxID=2183553 RepID=UPI002FC3972F